MKIIYTFIISCFAISLLSAQGKSIFTNAKPIDETRYSEYKGSPYLFDTWMIGDIYDAKGKAFEKMELNFNGYTNEVEVKKGDQYVTLDQKWYHQIEVQDKDQIIVYRRGVHSLFKNKFVEIVYDGKSVTLIKRNRVGLTEKEINDVGKTIKIKRFEKKQEYYFLKDGKLKNVKLKKKSILAYLGHKKEIESFAKKNKLKLTRVKDLQKVLAYYEAQGF